MDLERSVKSGVLHYWKGNKFGYTAELKEAGLFDENEAKGITSDDIEKRTVLIPEDVVKNILK